MAQHLVNQDDLETEKRELLSSIDRAMNTHVDLNGQIGVSGLNVAKLVAGMVSNSDPEIALQSTLLQLSTSLLPICPSMLT